MSVEYINLGEYFFIMNRIAWWIIKNNKKFNTRNIYGYFGREADLGTIIKVIKERKDKVELDGLIAEFVECAIVDNKDYSFLPNYVTCSDGKTQIKKDEFIDMSNRVSNYEVKNGKSPDIIYIKNKTPEPTPTPTGCTKPYTSSPHPTNSGCNGMGQNTSTYCAPSSVHKCLYKFGIRDISQATLASWMATNSSGTSHQGIETGIAKVNQVKGTNIKIQWYNKSDLSWEEIGKILCQPNKAIFCHILYKNGGTCSGSGNYGHYELLTKVNTDTGYVKVLNSLGGYCGSCYCGFYQDRTMACQEQFIRGISQKSIAVLTKQ